MVVITDEFSSYAFGLWCADNYWWSSSIGLTNVDAELVLRFAKLLMRFVLSERLKLRVYQLQSGSLGAPDQRLLQLVSAVDYQTMYLSWKWIGWVK